MNPNLADEFRPAARPTSELMTSSSGMAEPSLSRLTELMSLASNRDSSRLQNSPATSMRPIAIPLPTPEVTPPSPSGLISTDSLIKILRSVPPPILNHDGHPDGDQSASQSSPLLLSPKQPISLPVPVSTPVPIPTPHLLPATSVPLSSLEQRIVMPLCGELITYDLERLEEDPRVIIHLLKVTSSERGNWMTVGGHYRRRGNPAAALAVVTTMIEVLTKHGVPEDDLKPAYLMLSGCEADLAKKAKSADEQQSEISAEHYNRAQRWLQKVYGTQSPIRGGESAPSFSSSEHAEKRSDIASSPPTGPTGPSGRGSRDQGPARHGGPQGDSQADPSHEGSPSANYLHLLQREVQCLRDRQADQANVLSDIRSAKRRLEDDFACERSLRRKLERQLDNASKELEVTRRREDYALGLVRRETDSRRRAEERANEEREKRKELETENKTVRPLLEDLANIFQRAANGDGRVKV